jgi:hypothetical protein
MLIDDLSRLPDIFKDGHRGILLILRTKDGGCGDVQRKAIKLVSNGVSDWENKIREMAHLQNTSYPNHRIYSSVNSRVMRKAIHEFKHRQLDADLASSEVELEFYSDIKNRFFSAFMNPKCRETSYFLIDCDTEPDYEHAIEQIPKEFIIFDYETKNGRHIITKAFNTQLIKWAAIDVKRDELIFIG